MSSSIPESPSFMKSIQELSTMNPVSSPKAVSTSATSATSATNSNSWFGSTTTSDNSWFSDWFGWKTIVVLVLILALIGINVFTYLADGTTLLAMISAKVLEFFTKIAKLFGFGTLEVTKQTINTTNAGVDAVADTSIGAINTVQSGGKSNSNQGQNEEQGQTVSVQQVRSQYRNNASKSSMTGAIIEKENRLEYAQKQALNKALQDAGRPSDIDPDEEPQPNEYWAPAQKAGWCFVGRDSGYRICAEVGTNDRCDSNQIFPTMETCMNPALRP